MKTILKNLILFAFVMTVFTACQKDEENPKTAEAQSAEDNSLAEAEFDAVVNLNDGALKQYEADLDNNFKDGNDVTDGPLTGYACATVTISAISSGEQVGRKVIIDFTATGCTGPDGRTRKGKVIIEYLRNQGTQGNPYNAVGNNVTTTFDNYFVNDVKVEGTKVVTCTQASTLQNPVRKHTIVVTSGKLTFPDGKTILWASNRTRTWSFSNLSNITLSIEGTYNGTNKAGDTYSGATQEGFPLIYETECLASSIPSSFFVPTSGQILLESSAHPDALVNFGSGICDRTLTITVGGNTYTVNL